MIYVGSTTVVKIITLCGVLSAGCLYRIVGKIRGTKFWQMSKNGCFGELVFRYL